MLGISALGQLALAELPFAPQIAARHVGGMVGEGGPGRRRHRPDPWSKTLTRQHWKELQELVRAEADAAVEANRRDDPALAAAAGAAREAAEALQLAEETEAVNRDLRRVTAALDAATAAKTVAKRLRTAQRAEMEAKAFAAYAAILEDDEECFLLLN